ncbi:hypothetical protein GCM10025864_00880 [Luteimicrobium album]|uniref:Uncharacterized protein n=1 Tax=Luteimicrobium album TaxID=1054550 RepID=A0ABQ6HUY9_9MICO|nr:DUF6716 putative glycosyltransferase [Luteimicrobium album]GMA22329.1 hypothetical protein GCM10025864_00880 [Luteimicrobium album]
MTARVLAVADSDSYLKWAAATLDGLGDGFSGRLVLVASPVLPSDAQVAAAVGETAPAPPAVQRIGGSSGGYGATRRTCSSSPAPARRRASSSLSRVGSGRGR